MSFSEAEAPISPAPPSWWPRLRRPRTPAKPAFLAPYRLLPEALARDHVTWFANLSPAEQAIVLEWLAQAAQDRLQASLTNPYAPVPGLGVVITAHLRQAHAKLAPEGINRFQGLTYTAPQAAQYTGLAPEVPDLECPYSALPQATVTPLDVPARAEVAKTPSARSADGLEVDESGPQGAQDPEVQLEVTSRYPRIRPEPMGAAKFECLLEDFYDQLTASEGDMSSLQLYENMEEDDAPLGEAAEMETQDEDAPMVVSDHTNEVDSPVHPKPEILKFFLEPEEPKLEYFGERPPPYVFERRPRIVERPRKPPTQILARAASVPPRHRVLISAPTPLAHGENRATFTQLVSRLEDGLLLTPFPDVAVLAQLRTEFPWAQEALAPLEEALLLGRYVGQTHLSLPPVLLVGPPGCGKTRLARRLGELIGVPTWSFSAAGRYGGHALVGTDRHWSNAQASGLLQFMAHRDTANPLVIVDEIDKAVSGGQAGDLGHTLLPLLERESAARVNDPYLMADVDLSRVCWIATANDTSTLSSALLSRLTIIALERPRRTHVPAMVQAVRADLAASLGVASEALPPWSDADTTSLTQALPGSFSAREVSQAVRRRLVQHARGAHLSLVPPP